MPHYINESMLEERMTAARLNSLCKVTGAQKSSLLSGVIDRAEGMVDAFLSSRFKIPVPTNSLCEDLALAIAEHELYKRGAGGGIPEKIKSSYEKAMSLLQNVASGSINIPSAVRPQPANPKGRSMEIRSNSPLMDEDGMERF